MFEILLSEAALPSQAIELEEQLNNAWVELASSVFDPGIILNVLSDMKNNPLCLSITGALLVVFGFKFFCRMIFLHLERG